MPQVRIDEETMNMLQKAQVLLEGIDETKLHFGKVLKDVLKQWLKSALDVMTEEDYEPYHLHVLAVEIGDEFEELI